MLTFLQGGNYIFDMERDEWLEMEEEKDVGTLYRGMYVSTSKKTGSRTMLISSLERYPTIEEIFETVAEFWGEESEVRILLSTGEHGSINLPKKVYLKNVYVVETKEIL